MIYTVDVNPDTATLQTDRTTWEEIASRLVGHRTAAAIRLILTTAQNDNAIRIIIPRADYDHIVASGKG